MAALAARSAAAAAPFYYFTKWRKCDVWKKIHDKLHERARQLKERKAAPRAGIIDS